MVKVTKWSKKESELFQKISYLEATVDVMNEDRVEENKTEIKVTVKNPFEEKFKEGEIFVDPESKTIEVNSCHHYGKAHKLAESYEEELKERWTVKKMYD